MAGKNGDRHLDIKAVIFDYGEVLCHRPTKDELRQMGNVFGVEGDAFKRLWEKNRAAFDRGELTSEVYWSMFADDTGKKIDADQLADLRQLDMAMWSNVNHVMVAWAKELRAAGYKIAILSNMHPEMVEHIHGKFDWLTEFDFRTFSADVKMAKPDPKIYEHTLETVGVKAENALFIDDREANIAAARKLGIHAIQFFSVEQFRGELEKIGFPLLPSLN